MEQLGFGMVKDIAALPIMIFVDKEVVAIISPQKTAQDNYLVWLVIQLLSLALAPTHSVSQLGFKHIIPGSIPAFSKMSHLGTSWPA